MNLYHGAMLLFPIEEEEVALLRIHVARRIVANFMSRS